jgi:ribosome-associated protein
MTMTPPGDLKVNPELVIPAEEIHEAASRSGGPGGQHVNRSRTRVTLRWNVRESSAPSDEQRRRLLRRLAGRLTRRDHLVVHAGRHRSRGKNRALARERLAELVREALAVERARVPTRQSRASKKRILESKRKRSSVKRGRQRLVMDDG